MDRHQHVDWREVSIQRHDLNESLFILFTDTFNDQGSVPDKEISSMSAGNCHFLIRNEDGLSEVSLTLLFATEIFLLNSWRIVLECGYARLPRKEKDTLLTI
jgi:hypothetical protein